MGSWQRQQCLSVENGRGGGHERARRFTPVGRDDDLRAESRRVRGSCLTLRDHATRRASEHAEHDDECGLKFHMTRTDSAVNGITSQTDDLIEGPAPGGVYRR